MDCAIQIRPFLLSSGTDNPNSTQAGLHFILLFIILFIFIFLWDEKYEHKSRTYSTNIKKLEELLCASW